MGNHGVKKVIQFCYGHRLLDYDGKCRNLHGRNAQLEIEIDSGGLDRLEMVIDFGEIKDIAKGWVDDHLDHKMLLHRDDPIAKVLPNRRKYHQANLPYIVQVGTTRLPCEPGGNTQHLRDP